MPWRDLGCGEPRAADAGRRVTLFIGADGVTLRRRGQPDRTVRDEEVVDALA